MNGAERSRRYGWDEIAASVERRYVEVVLAAGAPTRTTGVAG